VIQYIYRRYGRERTARRERDLSRRSASARSARYSVCRKTRLALSSSIWGMGGGEVRATESGARIDVTARGSKMRFVEKSITSRHLSQRRRLRCHQSRPEGC
jgi:hypothetical protein